MLSKRQKLTGKLSKEQALTGENQQQQYQLPKERGTPADNLEEEN